LSLAAGDTGAALAFGYLHRLEPEGGWDRAAHAYLSSAVAEANSRDQLSLGLFGGLSGLGLALRYLSLGERYQQAIANVDEVIIKSTGILVEQLPNSGGVSVSAYDLISGITGTGAYLLEAARDSRKAESALKQILAKFLSWTNSEPIGFFTRAEQLSVFEQDLAARYPQGVINLGLAHGIPGPLALMSLALLAGHQVEGLAEAIRRLARVVVAALHETPLGIDIPAWLPLTGGAAENPTRTAWCYGNPGAARALFLAGKATDEPEFQAKALAMLYSVAGRSRLDRHIAGPTICHGSAGLLQITLRMLGDHPDPILDSLAQELGEEIMVQFDPAGPTCGFCEPNLELKKPLPEAGLLTGAIGTALVLLHLGSGLEPGWDRSFLLS
jgi:lantibiotic modifying enzyme